MHVAEYDEKCFLPDNAHNNEIINITLTLSLKKRFTRTVFFASIVVTNLLFSNAELGFLPLIMWYSNTFVSAFLSFINAFRVFLLSFLKAASFGARMVNLASPDKDFVSPTRSKRFTNVTRPSFFNSCTNVMFVTNSSEN